MAKLFQLTIIAVSLVFASQVQSVQPTIQKTNFFCTTICTKVQELHGRTFNCYLDDYKTGKLYRFIARSWNNRQWKFYLIDNYLPVENVCHRAIQAENYEFLNRATVCPRVYPHSNSRTLGLIVGLHNLYQRLHPEVNFGAGFGGNIAGLQVKGGGGFNFKIQRGKKKENANGHFNGEGGNGEGGMGGGAFAGGGVGNSLKGQNNLIGGPSALDPPQSSNSYESVMGGSTGSVYYNEQSTGSGQGVAGGGGGGNLPGNPQNQAEDFGLDDSMLLESFNAILSKKLCNIALRQFCSEPKVTVCYGGYPCCDANIFKQRCPFPIYISAPNCSSNLAKFLHHAGI